MIQTPPYHSLARSRQSRSGYTDVVEFASLGFVRTHLLHIISIILVSLLFVSCGSVQRGAIVDINISNDSANDLNWVRVRWDEGEQTAGVLPARASKISLDAGLPKAPKSDTAFVEFVDDKDGWDYHSKRPNSERKHYIIPVDVSALKRLSSGHYRVTFAILSFTEAKLQIEKKDK